MFPLRPEIRIQLRDNEWPYEYTDHDRQIARAIVFDDNGYFYFVRVVRNDDFGNATLIESSGGGLETGEDLHTAIRRELREELGANVEIVCKLGVVEDYYNLIHRHNINNYYLCRVLSFGSKSLTNDEIECFHLSTLKLTYDEALREYQKCSGTKLGRLIAQRELPILQHAKACLDSIHNTAGDNSMNHKIIRLIDKPEMKEQMANWFHEKWGIPLEAYLESMDECLLGAGAVPQWYVSMEGERIVGGLGLIENDFHDRKDLTPNVCAVYTEEDKRCEGIAGELLGFVCDDMKSRGISTLYLVTDHDSFYERYGWEFLCMVQGDGEEDMTRMYIHRTV